MALSLSAVQADGYYYDPSKFNPKAGRGSYDAISGTHKLGVRANRLHTEGILVIRFEMPDDSWCLGCVGELEGTLSFTNFLS